MVQICATFAAVLCISLYSLVQKFSMPFSSPCIELDGECDSDPEKVFL